MAYFEEFEADYAVPEVLSRLIDLGILWDTSWHNDVCPSVCLATEADVDGMQPRIWLDHPNPEMREFGPGEPRYAVSDTDVIVGFRTDDLREALIALGVGPNALAAVGL